MTVVLSGQIGGTGGGSAVATKGGGRGHRAAAVTPSGLPPYRSVKVCPRCHARLWNRGGGSGGHEAYSHERFCAGGLDILHGICLLRVDHFHVDCGTCKYEWREQMPPPGFGR